MLIAPRRLVSRLLHSPHTPPRIALAVVTLWSMLGLWSFSWWNNHDAINTPLRLAAFMHELNQGNLWVRWASLLNGGYGSPFFVFYAPGLMYMAAPFSLLGFHVLDSIKIATLLVRFVGVFSCNALAARRFGPWGGLCAGLAFALAPYLNALVFVRGALSEHAALCLIPLVMLSLDRALVRRHTLHLLWSALLLAAVICTHNITGLLLAPALLLWGLLSAVLNGRSRLALRVCLVVAWGIAISALFWLPAMALSSQVRINLMFGGWDDWTYMCHLDNLWSRFREIGGQPQFRNLTFAPGDWQILAAIVSLAIALRQRGRVPKRRRGRSVAHARFAALLAPSLVFIAAAAMFTWLDAEIWKRIPLVTNIQFPYRLLAIMTPMLCLAAAGVGRLFPRRFQAAWPALLLLTLIATSASMYPGPQTKAQLVIEGRERSVRAHRVESLLRTSYQTANNLDEYRPQAVSDTNPAVGSLASSEATVHPPENGHVVSHAVSSEENQRFHTADLSAPAELRFPIFAFSGWMARMDGEPVELRAHPDGMIWLECPAGVHEIELEFGLDMPTRIGLAISLAAILGGLLVMYPLLLPRRMRKRTDGQGEWGGERETSP